MSRQTCSPSLLRLVLVASLAVGAAWVAPAQIPQDHGGSRPPVQYFDAPPQQVAPVVPDTVNIRITVPDSLPQPRAVYVVQDTLVFGGLLHLVLDYDVEQVDGPELMPVAEGDWLLPYTAPELGFWQRLLGRDPDSIFDPLQSLTLPKLATADGLRVVRSFRVYRRDPFRISWQKQLSPVLVVLGQTDGSEQTATIRDPRSLGWTPWRLLVAAVLLALVAWWLYRLWNRRHQSAPLENWLLPEPAWLATAVGLQGLLQDNILARGDSRLFLDRLAYLARDYVAGRYRVPAREMTGGEIVAACTALGHDPGHPLGFARLIDLADRERYNPAAPDTAFCREQSVQLLGRISKVRLERQHIAVAAERKLLADKAWAYLSGELGTGAGRPVRATLSGEVR